MKRKRPDPAVPSPLLTVIGAGTTLTGGTVRVRHDLRIDGHVEADVEAGGRVILSAGASLQGHLVAPDVVVAGRLEGTARISGRLYVKATGLVSGQIRAGRLVIEEGARGQGLFHFARPRPALPAPEAPGESAVFSRAAFDLPGDGSPPDTPADPDTPGYSVNLVHTRGPQAPD